MRGAINCKFDASNSKERKWLNDGAHVLTQSMHRNRIISTCSWHVASCYSEVYVYTSVSRSYETKILRSCEIHLLPYATSVEQPILEGRGSWNASCTHAFKDVFHKYLNACNTQENNIHWIISRRRRTAVSLERKIEVLSIDLSYALIHAKEGEHWPWDGCRITAVLLGQYRVFL